VTAAFKPLGSNATVGILAAGVSLGASLPCPLFRGIPWPVTNAANASAGNTLDAFYRGICAEESGYKGPTRADQSDQSGQDCAPSPADAIGLNIDKRRLAYATVALPRRALVSLAGADTRGLAQAGRRRPMDPRQVATLTGD
jgi:hypothetical protein